MIKGGKAPDAQETAYAATLMNPASTPNQIINAAKEMNKQSLGRLGTVNDAYRRLSGEDFPDLISEDARTTLGRLGLGHEASRYKTGGTIGMGPGQAGYSAGTTGATPAAGATPAGGAPAGATNEVVVGGKVVGHTVGNQYVPLGR